MTGEAVGAGEARVGNQSRSALSGDRAFVLACVLLGGAERTILASLPRVLHGDEPSYLLIARSLAQGEGYLLSGRPDLHYGPLFPWLLSLPLRLWNDPEWASATIYIVAGALFVIPFFLLARALYGSPPARLATLLVTIFPALTAAPLVSVSMTEPIYLLFLFSGLALSWRVLSAGRDSQPPLAVYAGIGIAFGLAYLTRPEAVAYIAIFLGLCVLQRIVRRDDRSLRQWRGPLLALVIFAALAAPYVAYLHGQTGRWMLSGKVQITFDIGTNVIRNDARGYDLAIASLDATGEDLIWFSAERFRTNIVRELLPPSRFIYRLRRNWNLMSEAVFSAQTLSPWLLALIALGLFGSPWSRRRLGVEFFLLAVLSPLATYLIFHVEARFLVALYPVAMLWVALGLERLSGWMQESLRLLQQRSTLSPGTSALARTLPLAFTVAVLLLATGGTLGQRVLLPWDRKEAGEWLRLHAPPEAAVMSRSPEISLYADRPSLPSPNADWPQVLDYARRNGASYYVADRRELTELRPQLSFLADPAQAPPELIHETTIEGRYGQATVIYRFIEEP